MLQTRRGSANVGLRPRTLAAAKRCRFESHLGGIFRGLVVTCMSQEHVFFFERRNSLTRTHAPHATYLHVPMFPSAPLLLTPTTPCHNETASRHQTPNDRAAAHTYVSSLDESIPASISILTHGHSASSFTTLD